MSREHGQPRTRSAIGIALPIVLAAAMAGCRNDDAPLDEGVTEALQTPGREAGAGTIAPGEFEVVTGEWGTEEYSGRRVMVQRAKSAKDVYNLALADATARDLELSVRLAAVDGKVDQGGGVVWRAQGPGDYYIARYNPLESNFRVYFVKEGVRQQLDSATVDTDAHAWHTLSISMTGDHIVCSLDGRPLLDVHDDSFPDAGRVGLWTKADAVTRFDDLLLAVRDEG